MKVIQPRVFNPRKTLFVGTVILVLIVVTLTRNAPPGHAHIHWMGRTMGTHYDIKIAHSPLSQVEARRLLLEVERYLQRINDEMSTYIPSSEISQFNQLDSTEPFAVSASFAEVTRAALHWTDKSGGAFDPTLDPLINLWGFGHRQVDVATPTDNEIEAALALTGHTQIEVVDAHRIRKQQPEVTLNLNAIAKGYAVDGVAALLLQAGATNIYVEIGGDLVVFGTNREGEPWRIGIEAPAHDAAPGERLHGIAHLPSGALAGSGDYRRFWVDDNGQVFTHILDPRTGRPARHALASVNVWAQTCMDADAIATALIVMGLDEGLRWIETLDDAEAIFFTRQPDGTFEATHSSGFALRTGLQAL